MRAPMSVIACLATTALLAGAASASEGLAPYYNPTNSASESGLTIGSNLYKTIGCPGRGLLDPVCAEEVAPATVVVAPAPVVIEPTPAIVVIEAPAAASSVVVAEQKPVVSKTSTAQPGGIKLDECVSNFVKLAGDNLRNTSALFIKP